MKRMIKLYTILLILCMVIIFMPNQISAATTAPVTTIEELQTALADDTITAIELKNTIEINNDVTIEGKGKTITSSVKKLLQFTQGKLNLKILQ